MSTESTAPADGALAPEKNTEIPVQTSAAEPVVVATDDPPETTAGAEQPEADGAEAAQPEGQGKKPPKLPEWAQKQMAQQAFEAREAKRRAEAAEAELAKLRQPAQAEATQADAAAAQQNAPAGGYRSEADFNAAVQAEANRRAQAETQARAAAEFDAACNTAYTKGKAAFNDDFDAAVQNLQQVGFMSPDMLQFVLEADDPSKVLFELGSDPDRAVNLMNLTPAKRAIEIAKMTVPAPGKPTPLSRAPRPVDTVEGSARPSTEPADNDDDATWFSKRNEQIRRRYSAA